MLTLSEILIEQYKIETYKELKEFILKKIDEGEMFLSLDIKPNFDDTPDYWETDLENLFTSPKK
ncbi:MAG: sulfur relay protein DsrC [Gammaproteobacteria bacterium]|nr:sulfur relay protein DsrC [Gammaproteobacteria bacterium]|tara:strand:- start:325 stop:516 length:192 start_codon:yes stop_codon:yes gene_type:complete